jgi:general stress protein YciG
MAGTKAGGIAASQTNKKIHGSSFYANIGSLGGRACVPKGFACMPREKVSEAGRKGGRMSKRRRASEYL